MSEPGSPDWSQEPVPCTACPFQPALVARLLAVRRLPDCLLPMAMVDSEPAVRCEVARRIEPEWLGIMAWDRDAAVRLAVAERLLPQQLVVLVRDRDPRVRALVAGRIGTEALAELLLDSAEEVRRIARQRLDQERRKSAERRVVPPGRRPGPPLPLSDLMPAGRG